MPRTSSLHRALAAIALSALAAGCSQQMSPNATAFSASLSAVAQNSGADDPFTEAVNYATRASKLAQSAKSAAEWDDVAKSWLQAIYWMQSVPPGSPKRAFAQKKIAEYMRYLAYAQQRGGVSSRPPYPSFNSDILDEQLGLYLSYLAAVGRPDILIVGSSRALQGVDPRVLQAALASQGKPGLKIFNFGVNGATAQVVNFQLQKLLTPDQLPRMILWADGVRAFNSGREDRTYESILSSPGYERLASGERPTLSSSEPKSTELALYEPEAEFLVSGSRYDVPPGYLNPGSGEVEASEATSAPKQLAANYPSDFPDSQVQTDATEDLTRLAQASVGDLIDAIDCYGFLPMPQRFSPAAYYQQRPKVSGQYDADYLSFQLGGKQAAALNAVVSFTKARRIPLVFVNLPLTQDYLDSARRSYEQQFREDMRVQSAKGFVWRDFSVGDLSQNEYFTDPSHINLYGAAAVARKLGADSTIPWPTRG